MSKFKDEVMAELKEIRESLRRMSQELQQDSTAILVLREANAEFRAANKSLMDRFMAGSFEKFKTYAAEEEITDAFEKGELSGFIDEQIVGTVVEEEEES